MANKIIQNYVIHAVCEDDQPFFGTRAACIRYALSKNACFLQYCFGWIFRFDGMSARVREPKNDFIQRGFNGLLKINSELVLKETGSILQYLPDWILERIDEPDWWNLYTLEQWKIINLSPDNPNVLRVYTAEQGRKHLQSPEWRGWVQDWLWNGEKSRAAIGALLNVSNRNVVTL